LATDIFRSVHFHARTSGRQSDAALISHAIAPRGSEKPTPLLATHTFGSVIVLTLTLSTPDNTPTVLNAILSRRAEKSPAFLAAGPVVSARTSVVIDHPAPVLDTVHTGCEKHTVTALAADTLLIVGLSQLNE
jgi:hypothetical protein